MRCPSCGFDNPAGMKFCGQCAAPLTAAEQPQGCIGEGRQQMRIPLVHEIQRRHHDQRPVLGFLHGQLRQIGLLGAPR